MCEFKFKIQIKKWKKSSGTQKQFRNRLVPCGKLFLLIFSDVRTRQKLLKVLIKKKKK